jgi:multidrug efflux pump subunit AcrA (membrane-fusion protein)
MRRLTQKVVAAGEPFRYDGSIQNIPKQLEEPLAEFIQEAGSRFLLIVPLLQPERLIKPEEPMGGGKVKQVPRKPIGALIVERMQSSEPTTEMKTLLDPLVDHIAAATYNARSHSSIFLLPLWRATGRLLEWLQGSRLLIALASVLLIAAAGAALVYVPWDYRVDGKGQLMPITQREVFAPWDGQVVELYVEGDQHVVEGQDLLKLRNDDLEVELVKVRNEIQQKLQVLNALKGQIDEAEHNGKKDEVLKAQGESAKTRVELIGMETQRAILEDRRNRLTVRAPISGTVTTFQLKQLLMERPVRRGDLLLQVMDETGDWQLELEIDEHRVGRILKAQEALKQKDLPIEYTLLTAPENRYEAKLSNLATRTVTAEEHSSVMEARASLDAERPPKLVIGALVRARIGCGKSSLGDVLFGDVIEFIMKYLWW